VVRVRKADAHIGTAGWAIPRQYAGEFPSPGSHLERYARRFNAVEINSSFHRPHRRATYERWARVPAAAEPGGWPGLRYFRLHGSPRTYYSSYTPEQIGSYAAKLQAVRTETWCIFDNTTLGAATENALTLQALMR
jgi:uncharacterized protein YecE (DUF72 family)